MKKRIFALLLAAILMFCFVSCEENTSQGTETEKPVETKPDSYINYENPHDLEIDFKY